MSVEIIFPPVPAVVVRTTPTTMVVLPAAGQAGAISSDANNRLRTGTDRRLYVPEIAADPVAYYILAKG